jgi:CheY-like chemotaxis protein
MDGWRTARSIRQAGFAQVPIILVSANVFENRPENLAAAQCQAFVGKPVMESELLDTLSEHLQLAWITVLPGAPPDGDAAASFMPVQAHGTPLEPLPADAAWELHRLARKGHVQALSAALSDWRLTAPEHEPHWQALQQLVDQFELDDVAEHLTPYLNEDTLDERQA